ncbi:MAG: glycoside hydrolase family 9 protein [Lewinellaceae bacterium]|nr:glycoside hydrolase family 9 protein [Lewinellaceae bacterium]
MAQNIQPFIRIDQFGYRPQAQKVAVIANPELGYNAGDAFVPGTTYALVNALTQETVWTGTPEAWSNGALHGQSGDHGWWLDFSAVDISGQYYLYDTQNDVRSFEFEIGNDVYKKVLKAAQRMYFYQRVGMAKEATFAETKWKDNACYLGPQQDTEARSRWAKTDPSTARDVRGGWMDAGDVNKYTTFAESAVLQLLQAYRANPSVFTDDFNLPESGNGVPDLLDEVKWELDFFQRMQDATGTNGLLLKVGMDNYNDVSPPSIDTRPRYYLPECSSATLSGAAMFALAGMVYQSENTAALQTFGAALINRAQLAWQRAELVTANFSNFETDCDDGDIKSGDADRDANAQLSSAIIAAVYLFEATGDIQYRDFVTSQCTNVEPLSTSWWGPYRTPLEAALLRFAALNGVDAGLSNIIRSQKANMNYQNSLQNFNNETDLYRA